MTKRQTWDSKSYQKDTGFVSVYGEAVLDLLAPKMGERILDVGCGDGKLTQQLVTAGADVVGVDASQSFVDTAKEAGLNVRLLDCHKLDYTSEFDAVFTNAALHWMLEPEKVAAGVKRALKHGGRYVGEFGGFGNVAAVVSTMRAVGESMGGDPSLAGPWYFPTEVEYSALLEEAGFKNIETSSFYRPTNLPNGMESWLNVMRSPFFDQFGDKRALAMESVLSALKPTLCDQSGNWIADYVRLRFKAEI